MTAPERNCLRIWAPVVTEYAAWILSDAESRGIKRLYFLARDGYPMYLAARELVGEDPAWDLRYLRVSRYSLRLPELAMGDGSLPNWLFLNGIDVTMHKILRRGGLTDQEQRQAMRILDYDRSPDEILSRAEIRTWENRALARWKQLQPLFLKHARDAVESTIGYLEQEGLTDGTPAALVDSGWMGSTQQSISRLLSGARMEGYYFGLYTIPEGTDPSCYHTFYFRPGRDLLRKADFCNCLFEAVLSEPVGMTVGYRADGDGRYIPVLSDVENPNREKLELINHCIISYACQVAGDRKKNGWSEGLSTDHDAGIRHCERRLKRLMLHPKPGEVRWYGSMKFCDDMVEDDALQEVAAKLTHRQICDLRLAEKTLNLLGLRRRTIHESGWIYGSIVRNGVDVERNILQARWYRRLMYLRNSVYYKTKIQM